MVGVTIVGLVAKTMLPVPVCAGKSFKAIALNAGAPAVVVANKAWVAVVEVGAKTKFTLAVALSGIV